VSLFVADLYNQTPDASLPDASLLLNRNPGPMVRIRVRLFVMD